MKELRERLNQLIDRLGVAWEGLSERERLLVGSLAGVFGAFALFLAWFLTASAISDRRERVDGMYAAIGDIEAAAAEYGAREGERKAHELRLDKEVPSLKGHLEEVANEIGIPVDSFGSEKRTPAKGKKYDENSVEVKFRRVELPKITDFMKRLEGDREFAFVVKRLNVRVDFSDKSLLNVEMEVATYIRTAPLDKPPAAAAADATADGEGDEAGDGSDGAKPLPPGVRKPGLHVSPARPGGPVAAPGAVGAEDGADADFGDGARPATAVRPGPVRPVPAAAAERAAAAAAAHGAPGRPPIVTPGVKLPAPPKSGTEGD